MLGNAVDRFPELPGRRQVLGGYPWKLTEQGRLTQPAGQVGRPGQPFHRFAVPAAQRRREVETRTSAAEPEGARTADSADGVTHRTIVTPRRGYRSPMMPGGC